MSDEPEVELCVGPYPFSKKLCLSLRIGSSSRILARFDGEREMQAYLACNPRHDTSGAVKEKLEAIFDAQEE